MGADARRFTGKERDAETGLDYFAARYYGSTSGRFTTVDPFNILSEAEDEADLIAYLSAPQRWNRYGYALANPLNFKDPDGRDPVRATVWSRIVNNPFTQAIVKSDAGRRVIDSPLVSGATKALQSLDNRLFDLSMRLFASPADEAASAVSGQLSRALSPSDFGPRASVQVLEGTLTLQNSVATVAVRNIQGNLGNAMSALNALKDVARRAGASTLRIEGTVANPRLDAALRRLLGTPSKGAPGGAQDVWIIGVK